MEKPGCSYGRSVERSVDVGYLLAPGVELPRLVGGRVARGSAEQGWVTAK